VSALSPCPTEHEEQCTVIDWARWHVRLEPRLALLHAIPNGGLRNKTVAAKLKAEGVKAGVPDLCLPVPLARVHGLYIEMKRIRGGASSTEQDWWLEALRREGFECHVCCGAENAIRILKSYLQMDG